MTGFGAAEGAVAGGRLRVEVKTVNHRYFNFAPRLPADLQPLEGEIRERVRRELPRGHVSVSARWVEESRAAPPVRADVERARMIVEELKRLALELGLSTEISLDLVARQPEVLGTTAGETAEVPFAEVEPVIAAAAGACRAMRAREGAALAAELGARLDAIEEGARQIEARAPERLVRERDRLAANVAQLAGGVAIAPERLAQELALAADRLDIREELVRLREHVRASRALLARDGAVGKELGFLAQELGREINTIGSKANDAEIAHRVVALKGELERFREQLENLE